MAIPCSAAAWITSSSRTDPPGSAMAVTPYLAAASTPSRKGEKASEARTVPFTGSWARSAAPPPGEARGLLLIRGGRPGGDHLPVEVRLADPVPLLEEHPARHRAQIEA